MRKKFPKSPDSCLHEERRLENFFHRAKPESERERSGGELALRRIGGEARKRSGAKRGRVRRACTGRDRGARADAAKAIQLEEDS